MFEERDKWLFKICAILALPALFALLVFWWSTCLMLLKLPVGILLGWVVVVVIERIRGC